MRRLGIGVMMVLAVLSCGWFDAVRAQQATAAENPEAVMGEVVVTASREKEQTLKVPADVIVIDRKDIERSNAQNVPQLLEGAGIHVSDIDGNNHAFTVDLRGFGETAPANLLVLVDGRRINAPDLSGVDWSLIPIERIARIEVVPGPRGSVLYGDNATGGVINIITREGAGHEVRAQAEYGSYNTFNGAAGLSGADGIVSYNLSGSYLNSNGYRDNSNTRAKDAGANLRLDPNAHVSLLFSGGYHKEDAGMPGAIFQSDLDAGTNRKRSFHPDDFTDTEDYYVNSGLDLFFLSDDSFRLDVGYRRRSFSTFSSFLNGGTFEGDSGIDTVTVSPHFNFQEDFGEVSNRVIFGLDFVSAKENIINTSGGQSELKKSDLGYYIHDALGVTRHLTLSGGYRSDRAKFDLSTSGINFITGEPFSDDAEPTLKKESYTAGIDYTYNNAKVYISYGRSYRYPLLDEFFNYNDFQFNPDLLPQTSYDWEAGTQFNLTRDIMLKFNLFTIQTKNEIFYNPVTGANLNLDGDTWRNGFLARIDYRHGGWAAMANYTRTEARIEGGSYDGGTVPNVPQDLASAAVNYTFHFGLLLGMNAVYVGPRYFISDFANAFEKQKDYTVVNAKIEYTWHRLVFFANLNNIFDETYSSFGVADVFTGNLALYPSPEFNVLAGVRVRFGGA
jgi:iron complex outermembrane recepter protein